jgi:hypothetical protein
MMWGKIPYRTDQRWQYGARALQAGSVRLQTHTLNNYVILGCTNVPQVIRYKLFLKYPSPTGLVLVIGALKSQETNDLPSPCLMTSGYVLPSIHSFIHLAVCLTTGPKPHPKRALHIVRSRASSFRCEYPLLSLRSPSSFLLLLPHLHVISIPPFTFPSITCRRRQFLRKMWPIQLAFRLRIW